MTKTPGREDPTSSRDLVRIADRIQYHTDQIEALAREITKVAEGESQSLAVIGNGEYAREVRAS